MWRPEGGHAGTPALGQAGAKHFRRTPNDPGRRLLTDLLDAGAAVGPRPRQGGDPAELPDHGRLPVPPLHSGDVITIVWWKITLARPRSPRLA